MKLTIVVLFALLCVAVARAETIRQVIEGGMRDRLRESVALDPTATPRILAAFNRVKKQINQPLIMLKVVDHSRDPAVAVGNTVILRKEVETLSEVEIEFIVAHEAGHIVMKHTERRIKAYEKYIDGEVTEAKAKIANERVGREMMQISHLGEFEADRFAVKTVVALGRTKDEVINAFLNMSRTPDTATHPSTAKRVMNMRREGEPNE